MLLLFKSKVHHNKSVYQLFSILFLATLPIMIGCLVAAKSLYGPLFAATDMRQVPAILLCGEWDGLLSMIMWVFLLAFLCFMWQMKVSGQRMWLRRVCVYVPMLLLVVCGGILLMQGGFPFLVTVVFGVIGAMLYNRFHLLIVDICLTLCYGVVSSCACVWLNICSLEHSLLWSNVHSLQDWWYFYTDWHLLSSNIRLLFPAILLSGMVAVIVVLIENSYNLIRKIHQ